MDLSFINLVGENALFFTYPIPELLISMINENNGLPPDQPYILSFGRFVDFQESYHGKALTYFFEHMINNLQRIVVGETSTNYEVSYKFTNTHNTLDKEQLLFLCALLHHVNLKSYLLATISLVLKSYVNTSFENIKDYAKSSKFNMQIFTK